MKHLLPLSFLLISISCVQKKEDTSADSGPINTSAPYMWSNNDFPKSLQISNDFTADEVTNISDMGIAWKTSVEDRKDFFAFGARTPEISSSVGSLDDLYDNVLGIYKTSQWPADISASALAVTQIFGRRYNVGSASEYVEIEHADILINTDIHMFDTTDANGPGYDLRTVVLHEMGHFLGLQHKELNFPRSQSVMYPSIFSYEVKREPKQTDINDIAHKYGISLGGGGVASAAVSNRAAPAYRPTDSGPMTKILIELHADGKCIHKHDGVFVGHHHVKLKN